MSNAVTVEQMAGRYHVRKGGETIAVREHQEVADDLAMDIRAALAKHDDKKFEEERAVLRAIEAEQEEAEADES